MLEVKEQSDINIRVLYRGWVLRDFPSQNCFSPPPKFGHIRYILDSYLNRYLNGDVYGKWTEVPPPQQKNLYQTLNIIMHFVNLIQPYLNKIGDLQGTLYIQIFISVN